MADFTAKATVRRAVENVLVLLKRYKRGDVVPWHEIEDAASFDRYTQHWAAFFKRLRRDFLRQTGIALWAVPTVGMRLLTHQQQLTDRAVARRRRAFRQMRRDEEELRAVPVEELSNHQIGLRAHQIEAARRAKRAVLYQLRTSHALAKTSERVIPPQYQKSA